MSYPSRKFLQAEALFHRGELGLAAKLFAEHIQYIDTKTGLGKERAEAAVLLEKCAVPINDSSTGIAYEEQASTNPAISNPPRNQKERTILMVHLQPGISLGSAVSKLIEQQYPEVDPDVDLDKRRPITGAINRYHADGLIYRDNNDRLWPIGHSGIEN